MAVFTEMSDEALTAALVNAVTMYGYPRGVPGRDWWQCTYCASTVNHGDECECDHAQWIKDAHDFGGVVSPDSEGFEFPTAGDLTDYLAEYWDGAPPDAFNVRVA